MNKELMKRFKELTGYNQGDIGQTLGVTRQRVNQLWHNTTITYKAATAFALNVLIERKIRALEQEMYNLIQLKKEIVAGALRKQVIK